MEFLKTETCLCANRYRIGISVQYRIEIGQILDLVHFVKHQQRVFFFDPQFLKHVVDGCNWSETLGLLASATWINRSACRVSSSVALKLAIKLCGKSLMNPTVSLSKTGPQFGSVHLRVLVSSVAKSLSSARTLALVSEFISVLLPALV